MSVARIRWLLGTLAIGVAFQAAQVAAAPGDPDRSFGNGGVVKLGAGANAELSDLVPLDRGFVAVGGKSGTDFGRLSWDVLHFRGDGKLQRRFGSPAFERRMARLLAGGPKAAAVDAEGSLVVVGRRYESFERRQPGWVVVRYLASGEADATFADHGVATFDFSDARTAEVQAVAPDARGGYLVAGARDGEGVVARLNADGSLDTGFGSGGWLSFGAPASIIALARDSQNRVVVAGNRGPSPDPLGFVARFGADGQLDPGFGTAAEDGLGRGITFWDLSVAGDRPLLAGSSGGGAFAIRLDESGAPDDSFGQGGFARIRTGTGILSIAVDAGGRVVGAGSAKGRPAVIRLTASGAPDRGFAGDGWVRFGVGIDDAAATAVALTGTGRILVGGAGGGFRDESAFIARRLGGPPDSLAPRLRINEAERNGPQAVLVRIKATEDCRAEVTGNLRSNSGPRTSLRPRDLSLRRGASRWVLLQAKSELPDGAFTLRITVRATDSAKNSRRTRTTVRVARVGAAAKPAR